MSDIELWRSTDYVAGSGRRPHYCRIPIEGFHKFLRRRGWTFADGMWAEKEIAGRGVLMFVDREEPDHAVCKLILYDDFWAEYIRLRRDEEAVERRRAFEVVDQAGRRKARRVFPCLTVLLKEDAGNLRT